MCGLRGLKIGLVLAAMGLSPTSGMAGPIDPRLFSSLGSFPGASGAYSINTSGVPTITGPGNTTITGVVYQDTPGHSVAVFVFDSINVLAGDTITATGSLPLVLLSKSDVTIAGTINASAGTQPSLGGGGNGIGGPGGGGVGNLGPGGGSYIFEGGSGGGFGGAGGASGVYTFLPPAFPPIPSLPGGGTYGDLNTSLQGGSAGGLGSGGGGGGLEIGALGSLTMLTGGSIQANGAGSDSGLEPIVGGGSGGGIFLYANNFSLAKGSLISARGGNGGGSVFNGGPNGGTGGGGGGGGGGRILVEFNENSNQDDQYASTFDVSGGRGGSPGTGTTDGQVGLYSFVGVNSLFAVPEPSSLAMVTIAIAIGAGGRRLVRRRTRRA